MTTLRTIKDFFESIIYEVPIYCIAIKDGKTLLRSSDILHARKGLLVWINGNQYTIEDVDADFNIIIIDEEINETIYSPLILQKLKFFHGTPYAVNNHISKRNTDDKAPFVWLVEVFNNEDNDIFAGTATRSTLQIFYCDFTNYRDWNTAKHYDNVIEGLDKTRKFVQNKIIKNSKQFYQEKEKFNFKYHAKFGQYQTFKGHINSIFSEYLDSVEQSFLLNIRKDCFNYEKQPLCTASLNEVTSFYTNSTRFYQWQH